MASAVTQANGVGAAAGARGLGAGAGDGGWVGVMGTRSRRAGELEGRAGGEGEEGMRRCRRMAIQEEKVGKEGGRGQGS
jgi:hypothetical protein